MRLPAEADLVGDIGDAEPAFDQQLLGPFDAPLGDETMRRATELHGELLGKDGAADSGMVCQVLQAQLVGQPAIDLPKHGIEVRSSTARRRQLTDQSHLLGIAPLDDVRDVAGQRFEECGDVARAFGLIEIRWPSLKCQRRAICRQNRPPSACAVGSSCHPSLSTARSQP